jgi:hypothetical protein
MMESIPRDFTGIEEKGRGNDMSSNTCTRIVHVLDYICTTGSTRYVIGIPLVTESWLCHVHTV